MRWERRRLCTSNSFGQYSRVDESAFHSLILSFAGLRSLAECVANMVGCGIQKADNVCGPAQTQSVKVNMYVYMK
jgi:hypothetical protein